MTRESNRYPWRFGIFMIAYHVTNAVYQGYAAKYFEPRVNSVQFTILMTAMPLISIFMQPLWGTMGDRSKSRNVVLRLLVALSFCFILAYRISDSFWWLLPASLLFASVYTAIQPMGDSIVLEALAPENHPFGPIRLCGCLAFALANIALGRLLGGDFSLMIPLTAGLLCALFASSFLLDETPGHQHGGRKMRLSELFKLADMLPLMIMTSLLQLTLGYYYSFFSVHFTSLPGGSVALLGLCFFLSATSETPFLLNADRLFDRLGVGRLLCIAAATLSVRWTIVALSHNVYLTLFSQLLHGWGFIVITVSMSKYINNVVPAELKASGQMLLSVVGFGMARVFGILGGGLLAEIVGRQQMFFVMAGAALLALLCFAPRFLKEKPLNGNN